MEAGLPLMPKPKELSVFVGEEREFDQLFLEFNIQASYTNLRRAVESMYAHIGIRVTGLRLKHGQKRIHMCMRDFQQPAAATSKRQTRLNITLIVRGYHSMRT